MDAQIEFRMDSKQQQQQPPTDPMAVFANPFNEFNKGDEVDGATSQVPFLVKHQKDIVCGPCVMESFSEMPSFSGSVSLTSSELMASRDRSFLLYIGAVEEAQSPPHQDSKDPPESEGKIIKSPCLCFYLFAILETVFRGLQLLLTCAAMSLLCTSLELTIIGPLYPRCSPF